MTQRGPRLARQAVGLLGVPGPAKGGKRLPEHTIQSGNGIGLLIG